MKYIHYYSSQVGKLILASDGENLVGCWIEHQKFEFRTCEKEELIEKDLDLFQKTDHWLDDYFLGNNPTIDFPLKPQGSSFQKDVWKLLTKIPYGTVVTYGEIAHKLCYKYKKKVSAQAVGGAVGHNPISIFIPCHRVVGANGKMIGYAGGVNKKVFLLKNEHIDFVQTKLEDPNLVL